MGRMDQPATLLTVGHGTLDRNDLGDLLTGAGVEELVDIRRFPGSRHNPDARREALEQWLPERGIGYRWEQRLGGRRRLTADEDAASPDPWWRVAQFRAYAAGTRTEDFRVALQDVLTSAAKRRTAVMCSEAVWWRCHRRIVADLAVLQHGVPVLHLMHTGLLTEHPVSEGARLTGSREVVWDGHDRET